MESAGMTDKQFKVFLKTMRWVVESCKTVDEIIKYLDVLIREV